MVSLDGVKQRFLLEERVLLAPKHREVGYAVTQEESGIRVTQLFESSPAADAGLQLGDRVVAIDSQILEGPQAPERCELATLLLEEINWATPVELTVERKDEQVVLHIPAMLP